MGAPKIRLLRYSISSRYKYGSKNRETLWTIVLGRGRKIRVLRVWTGGEGGGLDWEAMRAAVDVGARDLFKREPDTRDPVECD